jgi:putative transposase
VGVHKPTRVRTTIPAEDAPPLPDLIGRGFDPGAPDVAWVGDITYVPTGDGWLYLAPVLDLGSRRLLGYSLADHMRTELVVDALTMAAGVGAARQTGSFSTVTGEASTSLATTGSRSPTWAGSSP